MPIRESSATALVRCTGLAMICYKKDQRCEIGFIRDDAHVLTFKILRPFYQDGTNDVVTYRAVVLYGELPNDNVHVEIRAQGASIAGCQIHHDPGFERLSSNDPSDFGWLVNFDELYGESTLSPTSRQPYSLARVNILNGLLYTHQLDEQLVFEKVRKDANGKEGKPEGFGRVAETLGARLDGDEVTLNIRIGDMEATHSLPRVAGLPYIIELSNVDPTPDAAYSDMPVYDQYMASPSGEQFELRPVWQAKNQQDFCHPVVFPLESLDQL